MSRFSADLLTRAMAAVSGSPAAPPPAGGEDVSERAIEIAAAMCRQFEGFRSHPYLCSAGVPTVGYGATSYLDGRAIKLTDPPISREAAERLLVLQVRRVYLPAVRRLCPDIDTPERLAALVDFCFNLGPGNLAASTLRRRVNDGRWAEVPAELMKWVRGGGRVLPGLVARRRAEGALV